MQLFYVNEINNNVGELNETESKHCINVLRHTVSDNIHLTDGKGYLYVARIIDANPRACRVVIDKIIKDCNENNAKLHIAIAPPKQIDRFEWFIEKSVEIGISEITPLLCSRSERKEIKTERLDKIIIAAMKQALVTRKPQINQMMSFKQFIQSTTQSREDRFIAYCSENNNKSVYERIVKGHNAFILIGPEGDFTSDEIQLALSSGWSPITLGKRRLRTETAALVACTVFNMINC
jgi:16S rRNA (uracil1498-N3)-methyltransferase